MNNVCVALLITTENETAFLNCILESLVHCSFKEKILSNGVDLNLHMVCLKAY